MIYGIGTDILKISRLEPLLSERNTDAFFKKTYTPAEQALIETKPNPIYSYATRFAGKEAIFKAFSIHGNDILLNEIEILEDSNGVPCVFLHGRAKALSLEKNFQSVLVSLSYDTDYAIAYATIEQ